MALRSDISVKSRETSALLNVSALETTVAQKVMGLLAALAMVLVWSGYFLSLRSGAQTPVTTYGIALLRFALPGLLLIPVFWRALPEIRRVPRLYRLGLLLGGGLPFFLLGAWGMMTGRVAEGSTLIPGVAPLFVTAIAVLVFRQPLSGWRLIGLILIFSGVAAFVMNSLSEQTSLMALLLFLAASFLWSLFALSIRQAGLKPLVAASVVTVPSGALLLLLALLLQPATGWSLLTAEQQLWQLTAQGLGAGLASGVLFAFAIRRLGAELTSAIGSLTPVVASLLAFFWFNEAVTPLMQSGIFLVSCGVVLSSGLVGSRAS